jgi:hypothetical protein
MKQKSDLHTPTIVLLFILKQFKLIYDIPAQAVSSYPSLFVYIIAEYKKREYQRVIAERMAKQPLVKFFEYGCPTNSEYSNYNFIVMIPRPLECFPLEPETVLPKQKAKMWSGEYNLQITHHLPHYQKASRRKIKKVASKRKERTNFVEFKEEVINTWERKVGTIERQTCNSGKVTRFVYDMYYQILVKCRVKNLDEAAPSPWMHVGIYLRFAEQQIRYIAHTGLY